jgi:hypothetical protein
VSHWQFFDLNIPKLDVVVVSKKTDMPSLAQQAGMFLQCRGIRHIVQVRVDNRFAV